MRDYSRVGPQFWIGATGKKLRAEGQDAQVVGMYLMTSPHANMLGLYYLPVMFIAHETGMTIEGALKGLRSAIKAGFCLYDEVSEVVWVIEMAAYQIAPALEARDKRCIGVQNEYESLPENAFLKGFFDKYAAAFHMQKSRGIAPVPTRGIEGASKPLRSQDQDQDQDQEQEQEQDAHTRSVPRETEDQVWSHVAEIKAIYPKAAREDWLTAEKHARQHVAEGHATWRQLKDCVARYARLVKATHRHVLNPANFFSAPDRPWQQEWPLPEPKTNGAAPPRRSKSADEIERERAARGEQALG